MVHFQRIYGAINDHNQAIVLLNGKTTSATTTAGATTENVTQDSVTTIINNLPGTVLGGQVNDQTGATNYTTQQSDNGGLIVLDDAAPIAVTLNPNLTAPWYATLSNQGAGTVTITPSSGTINGGASATLASGQFVTVYIASGSFWADTSGSGSGTITAVIAGAGLTGGGSSGSVTLALAFPAYTAKTANYLAGPLDYQIECTANSFTVTLPTAVGVTGKVYSIKNSGTGVITLATTSSQTIDGSLTQTLTQYDNLVVFSNGANWIIT
jgi:hypothetical protein